MNNYSISAATAKDINEVKRINEVCLPENYSVEIYEQLLPGTVLCKDKNKIIGYAILANLAVSDKDIEPYSFEIKNRTAYTNLFSLAVMPEYRNKGVAKRLINVCIKSNKGRPILLNVRTSNSVAFNLYVKAGFTIVKKIENYYQNPVEDAYLMAYTIVDPKST